MQLYYQAQCILHIKHSVHYTVKPLNTGTFGTGRFVLRGELGCPLSEVIFYRVCIHQYFQLVLC